MKKSNLITIGLIIIGSLLLVNVIFFQEPLDLTFSQSLSTYGLAIYCLCSGYWIKLLFIDVDKKNEAKINA